MTNVVDLARDVAVQRRLRGWTQEDLAERTGLSVRTIRNLELGVVQNPRRSSVDLLADALGVFNRSTTTDHRPHQVPQWRGTKLPALPVIEHHPSAAQLSHLVKTVAANQLTTFVGPGGVGKTSLAFGVALELGSSFRDGVAVVELSDLVPEHVKGESQAPSIARRVRRVIGADRPAAADNLPLCSRDTNLLLIMDNTEHVPVGSIQVARDLLNQCPDLRIVITARSRLTERLGSNQEIQPLSVEPQPGDGPFGAPAVEFVLRHLGGDSMAAASLLEELPSLVELCRRLDGIPRYLEFAAERLRTLPIQYLLSCGPSLDMLFTHDHALPPHQQSVAASIKWDVDLLSCSQRRLLECVSSLPTSTFAIEDVMAAYGESSIVGTEPLVLMSELMVTPLVRADTEEPHHYRLAPYVGHFVQSMTSNTLRRRRRPCEALVDDANRSATLAQPSLCGVVERPGGVHPRLPDQRDRDAAAGARVDR
ncbi:ATP-binding protein [Nonomuraea sp. NPDC052265]|uniref:ATP-binding protein n=1 Tax=Nonomuraea sp. NPDC052265 TaxID=3364374 RepID=UPI0037CC7D14